MSNSYGGYESQEFVAELYDSVYAGRSPRDVNFFVEYSKQSQGKTLELGCGTGRVLIPTAVAGCQAVGLDFSAFMLEKCRQKLANQSPEVQARAKVIQGNMADFSIGEQYALITVPFRPFQHLISVEEQKACLACIREHLAPQGILILDVVNCYPPSTFDPKFWVEQETQKDIVLPDGRRVRCTLRIADFHRAQQYNDMELIYYITQPDGQVHRLAQAFPFRYFYRFEIEHLLELCGFRVVRLFGDYDKSEYYSDSPEMIFVAEKR